MGRTAVLPNLNLVWHWVATAANTEPHQRPSAAAALPERTYISYITFQIIAVNELCFRFIRNSV